MSDDPQPNRTVYLLHFDAEVRGARHYIGITRTDRVRERMIEHAQGRGGRIVARAIEDSVGFFTARLWPSADFTKERALKRAGHYEKLCPICRGELPLDFDRKHYDPQPIASRQVQSDRPPWEPYA